MAIRFWLTHPILGFHRLRYWVWERLHPDKPWLCPGTVRFCERRLHRGMSALEFGSGRSTVWFAGLTSVEHDRDWYERVRGQLAQNGVANVDYRLVPLEHPESEPEDAMYEPLPAYVRTADGFPDSGLDFVVVDGHYRTHCVRRAVPKVKPGGYLLVDDINLWPSPDALPVPAGWQVADDSTNGLKRCIVWQAT